MSKLNRIGTAFAANDDRLGKRFRRYVIVERSRGDVVGSRSDISEGECSAVSIRRTVDGRTRVGCALQCDLNAGEP